MSTLLSRIAFLGTRPEYGPKLAKLLPHGSGIDGRNEITKAGDNEIVISSEFHHMDENGFYAGWFYFDIVVRPSLKYGMTVTFRITKNDTDLSDEKIRELYDDYLCDTFYFELGREVEQTMKYVKQPGGTKPEFTWEFV